MGPASGSFDRIPDVVPADFGHHVLGLVGQIWWDVFAESLIDAGTWKSYERAHREVVPMRPAELFAEHKAEP
jgi:hypothetical protein